MPKTRRSFSAAFKAKVALELIKGEGTLASVCSQYEIHPTQASSWKTEALKGLSSLFESKTGGVIEEKDNMIDELYTQIGKLNMELNWLKKKCDTS